MFLRGLTVICFFVSATAHAKLFRNAYVSFELPPNWNCKLEGSEWVCENDFAARTKEAIIILTAKEVGPMDSLAGYMAHLQTPRTIPGKAGNGKSQVIHVKQRVISNYTWIDGMHLGSEVGPYFTRYLATIKDKIAILVTFSAHKEHYTKYSSDFIKAIESLRVVATKDTLSGGGAREELTNSPKGTVGPVPGGITDLINEIPPPDKTQSGKLLEFLIFAAVLSGVGVYLYMRKNKTGTRKSPPPRKTKK